MQNIIDDSYPYELVDENLDHYKYDFVSLVKKEIPKRVSLISIQHTDFYNLGFGDFKIDQQGKEVTDDKAKNLNITDGNKILATALTCSLDFLTRHPDKKIIFFGNSPVKHRLYKMRLCGKIEALRPYLIIKGAVIENYHLSLDSDGFKDIESTLPINADNISYEEFAATNCNKYHFITFELIKEE